MDSILLVCMGNICRSPMAESVAHRMIRDAGLSGQFEFDSAGTHAHPKRSRTDPRVNSVLERKGYEPIARRARPVLPEDFERFDLILAMDLQNLAGLKRNCSLRIRTNFACFSISRRVSKGPKFPTPFSATCAASSACLNCVRLAFAACSKRRAQRSSTRCSGRYRLFSSVDTSA